MSPQKHIKTSIILLSSSIALEAAFLAKLFSISDLLYHSLHILLMVTLIGSQLSLFLLSKRQNGTHKLALWFAIGTALTAIGDFVNGAVSQVQPVSLKLSWALLFFGSGYALYNYALWKYNSAALNKTPGTFSRLRHFIVIPFLIINVTSWFLHVEPGLRGMDLLYYGSFVFNATIYVMMPTVAVWYFYNSRQSVGGLLVLMGALLIPYSDLVLFNSWFRGGNPSAPSFELYAYNWLVYFSGQVLISLFPALVMNTNSNNHIPGEHTA